MIRASALSKRYRLGGQRTLAESLQDLMLRRRAANEIWAVKDVSFDVARGDRIGLIGRNGAGKSTLLKILTRITRPTHGNAEIYGRVGSLLEVGTGFHPELSGRQNIFLNGAILGMTRHEIQRQFDEIVAFSEVERFIDTPVKYYSSGMYTRLAFSVAAHLDTEVILVDEVLAVGDFSFQQKCLRRMSDMTGEGRTVVFVSHNVSAITRLCPRTLLMERGQVVMDGPSHEVVAEYIGRSGGSSAMQWSADEAPGSEQLRLVQVAATRNGAPTMVFSVSEPIDLRISYRVSPGAASFRVAVILYCGGATAFASVEPAEKVRPGPGIYESSVVIPPHLVADTEYLVHVSIFSSRGVKLHHVLNVESVRFQVVDSLDGTSARGDYSERLQGAVMPKLEWSLRKVE